MKSAGWFAGLTFAVCTLLLSLLFGPVVLLQLATSGGPVFIQDYPPPTELPSRPGVRAVWVSSNSPESMLRPGDVLVERVVPASEPFAAHYPEPLYQAAVMARHCQAAVIVTLDEESRAKGRAKFVEGATGTVDEVLVDHSGGLAVGSRLWLAAHEGTHVTNVGDAQIVERYSYVRVPRAGGRYLVFIGQRGHGQAGAVQIGYGNAFEIRGRSVVGMTVPGSGSWHVASSVARVKAVVRRRGVLPAPMTGEWEEKEDLLR